MYVYINRCENPIVQPNMVKVKSSQDGGEYGSVFGTHLLESLRETTELHAKEIRSIYCLLLTVTLLVAGAVVSLAFYVHESNKAAIFVSESAAIPPPSTSGVHFPTEAPHARYAQMLLLMQTGPEMPFTNCPGLEHFMNTPGCGVDVDGGE